MPGQDCYKSLGTLAVSPGRGVTPAGIWRFTKPSVGMGRLCRRQGKRWESITEAFTFSSYATCKCMINHRGPYSSISFGNLSRQLDSQIYRKFFFGIKFGATLPFRRRRLLLRAAPVIISS
jgi:hypothetical protein